MVSRARWILPVALALAVPVRGQIELPTPLAHYEDYDADAAGQRLLLELAVKIPEESRGRALELFQRAKEGEGVELTAGEAMRLLDAAGWREWRPELLRLLLHRSNVLDVVPEAALPWMPLIHDSLLFFVDRVSDERLVERIVAQANLAADVPRGERVLAFIVNTPSLQKLAQILARNRYIEEDFRVALQTVENSLSSARYEDIRAQIDEEIRLPTREQYQLVFADRLLAEASVGAVLEATFVDPESDEPGRAACKVLKPHAVAALREDLDIIDELLAFLEAHAEFYDIGETPLVDIFQEIGEALSREVLVEDERNNLVRAREYYADVPAILVPEVYPFSSANITCMEFVRGVKITDAFSDDPTDRAMLARRLSDAMTYDVLFSRKEDALFHGDPHAGNVFSVDGAEDPFRIALLDWGLAAEFSRQEREKLVQLMLGLRLRHAKRLANNVDVLVEWEPEGPAERDAMRAHIDAMLEEHQDDDRGMFALLDELIVTLAQEGYSVRFNSTMFIKSQVTISGILAELDPSFEQDDYVMDRIGGQVGRELHTRLLRTIYFPDWNSHDYTSMLSNEDVKDVQFQKIGGFLKKVGTGIWKGVTLQWLF